MKNIMKTLMIVALLISSTAVFATYDEALQLFKQKNYKQSLKKVAEILIISNDLKQKVAPLWNIGWRPFIFFVMFRFTDSYLNFIGGYTWKHYSLCTT